MLSCTGRIVTRVLAVVTAAGLVACSESKSNSSRGSAAYTLEDGAVVDAPGEEVGDGWVSGGTGSSDSGADALAPAGCFADPASTVNTFVPALVGIEIDGAAAGSEGNANLIDDSAADPKVDWQQINPDANHRIVDDDAAKGTAFPGSNSCVNPDDGKTYNSPPKDDLLQVGLASNNSSVFLNVLRASGEGDMGYAILVTQERPQCTNKDSGVTGAKCDGRFFKFNLTTDDVLIWGHFKTGTTELLSVHPYVGTNHAVISAQNAIDFGSANWGSSAPGVQVAVNPVAVSAAGWAPPGSGLTTFADRTFAEGSIPLTSFGNVCGKTLWMTVISNSEGNDPTNGDVKDLLSPRRVNFGSLSATAYAKPNCDGTVDLQATITGAGGTPTCTWHIGSKTVGPFACDYLKGVQLPSGDGPFPTYVVVSDSADGGTGCAVTSPTVSVARPGGIVLDAITASTPLACSSATPNSDFDEGVDFSVQPAAGSAAVTNYTWWSCPADDANHALCTQICTSGGGDAGVDGGDAGTTNSTCKFSLPSTEGNCARRVIKVIADDGTGNCPAVSATRLYTKTTTIATSSFSYP